MKTTKKSQMEIMGLAIIVVLITVGIFLFLSFKSKQGPVDQKKEFGNIQLATNIINSILETTTEACYGQTFSEILQKCASGTGGLCQDGSTNYCTYFKTNVDTIFASTLDLWVPTYSFNIEYTNSNPLPFPLNTPIKDGCGVEEKIQRRFTVPSTPASVIILEICG